MNTDKETELLLTTEEAIALVKRSERERATWALHVRGDAAIVDQPEKVYRGGLSHYLNLSRGDALKLATNMLHKGVEEKGGRIRVVRREYTGVAHGVTYWIG
jgi:hypothetical protein